MWIEWKIQKWEHSKLEGLFHLFSFNNFVKLIYDKRKIEPFFRQINKKTKFYRFLSIHMRQNLKGDVTLSANIFDNNEKIAQHHPKWLLPIGSARSMRTKKKVNKNRFTIRMKWSLQPASAESFFRFFLLLFFSNRIVLIWVSSVVDWGTGELKWKGLLFVHFMHCYRIANERKAAKRKDIAGK